MDEADNDGEAEGGEEYDSADDYDDELYKGAADKAELLAKTDLEREMILADRHERKQRRIETLRVRALVRDEQQKNRKEQVVRLPKRKSMRRPHAACARALLPRPTRWHATAPLPVERRCVRSASPAAVPRAGRVRRAPLYHQPPPPIRAHERAARPRIFRRLTRAWLARRACRYARSQKQQQQSSARAGKARAATSAADSKKEQLAQLAAKRKQSTQQRSAREKEEEREREREAAAAEAKADEGGSEDGELVSAADADDAAGGGRGGRARDRAEPSGGAGAGRGAERKEVTEMVESAAPVKELERIRLTRTKLEKWLNEPFFEGVVVGCFVRVGIGMVEGRPTYRVAEIKGVKDGCREYSVEKKLTQKVRHPPIRTGRARGGACDTAPTAPALCRRLPSCRRLPPACPRLPPTDTPWVLARSLSRGQRLILMIGNSQRDFQISYVSNSDFDHDELAKYDRILRSLNLQSKSFSYIEEKVRELLTAKNYTYSDVEVEQKIKKERANLKMKGNLALRRMQLQTEIQGMKEALATHQADVEDGKIPQGALCRYSEADVAAAEGELREIDKKSELEKKIEQKRAGSSFRITDINERNRAFQRSVEARVGQRDLDEQVEISAGRLTFSDPFKRLPIRPVIYWDVGKKKAEPPAALEMAPGAADPPAPADGAAGAAGSSSSDAAALTVDTDALAGAGDGAGEVLSPGMAALVDTPRAASNGAGGAAAAAAGASGASGPGGPTGKRAQAHNIDFDIDLGLGGAEEAPRARPVTGGGGMHRPTTGGGGSVATGGQRLSLADYKRRMGME